MRVFTFPLRQIKPCRLVRYFMGVDTFAVPLFSTVNLDARPRYGFSRVVPLNGSNGLTFPFGIGFGRIMSHDRRVGNQR